MEHLWTTAPKNVNPTLFNWSLLTLPWRRSRSYRNQSIDLHSISMGWFLHGRDLRHERVSPCAIEQKSRETNYEYNNNQSFTCPKKYSLFSATPLPSGIKARILDFFTTKKTKRQALQKTFCQGHFNIDGTIIIT